MVLVNWEWLCECILSYNGSKKLNLVLLCGYKIILLHNVYLCLQTDLVYYYSATG